MTVWKLIAANNVVKMDEPIPEAREGEVKIRVTKTLCDFSDLAIVNGAVKANYPVVPGRFAVGVVAEGDNPRYPKGARVLLHTFLSSESAGAQKKDFAEDDYGLCGQTLNGYLRDFVCAREDGFTVLPESVSDEKALAVQYVALAKTVSDALNVQKGDHIAVIGANTLGILLSQLLIYQQASPILIDARAERLEFAKKCGVYYTLLQDENLPDGVAELTGGRLADSAVYITSSENDKSDLFHVCKREGKTAFCGFQLRELNVNIDLAMKKQLVVYGISGGKDNIQAAINLIANKAVDFSRFPVLSYTSEQVNDMFRDIASHTGYNFYLTNML